MKFLCVSDQIDPLVYSTVVKERYGEVDAVLCAGDLSMEYIDFIVSSLGKPTFFVFGNHNLEEFHLYEKSHSQQYQSQSGLFMPEKQTGHGAEYISGKVIRTKRLFFPLPDGKKTPLLIAGVSGSRRYNRGECQYTEFQMKIKLLKLFPKLLWNRIRYGRWLDVFLTHASPRHIHDREDLCHQGFECFNSFIKKYSPALLVHGHIHLYDLQASRETKISGTTVVNAYSHLVIELNINKSDKGDSYVSGLTVFHDR